MKNKLRLAITIATVICSFTSPFSAIAETEINNEDEWINE